MVDLFFYRDPEEAEKAAEEAGIEETPGAGAAAFAARQQWDAAAPAVEVSLFDSSSALRLIGLHIFALPGCRSVVGWCRPDPGLGCCAPWWCTRRLGCVCRCWAHRRCRCATFLEIPTRSQSSTFCVLCWQMWLGKPHRLQAGTRLLKSSAPLSSAPPTACFQHAISFPLALVLPFIVPELLLQWYHHRQPALNWYLPTQSAVHEPMLACAPSTETPKADYGCPHSH